MQVILQRPSAEHQLACQSARMHLTSTGGEPGHSVFTKQPDYQPTRHTMYHFGQAQDALLMNDIETLLGSAMRRLHRTPVKLSALSRGTRGQTQFTPSILAQCQTLDTAGSGTLSLALPELLPFDDPVTKALSSWLWCCFRLAAHRSCQIASKN